MYFFIPGPCVCETYNRPTIWGTQKTPRKMAGLQHQTRRSLSVASEKNPKVFNNDANNCVVHNICCSTISCNPFNDEKLWNVSPIFRQYYYDILVTAYGNI